VFRLFRTPQFAYLGGSRSIVDSANQRLLPIGRRLHSSTRVPPVGLEPSPEYANEADDRGQWPMLEKLDCGR